ncbi:MAG: hypothetical protein KC501_25680 [Myxococcales bacterium]|nr:hypothetical protein [Myxococcales bacterium]
MITKVEHAALRMRALGDQRVEGHRRQQREPPEHGLAEAKAPTALGPLLLAEQPVAAQRREVARALLVSDQTGRATVLDPQARHAVALQHVQAALEALRRDGDRRKVQLQGLLPRRDAALRLEAQTACTKRVLELQEFGGTGPLLHLILELAERAPRAKGARTVGEFPHLPSSGIPLF